MGGPCRVMVNSILFTPRGAVGSGPLKCIRIAGVAQGRTWPPSPSVSQPHRHHITAWPFDFLLTIRHGHIQQCHFAGSVGPPSPLLRCRHLLPWLGQPHSCHQTAPSWQPGWLCWPGLSVRHTRRVGQICLPIHVGIGRDLFEYVAFTRSPATPPDG